MTFTERYRPRCLAEIVGQPGPVRYLRRLAESPQPACILLESSMGGTGKTATAQAFAAELGCHDEFSGLWRIGCAEFGVDSARELFGRTLRLRWGSKSGFSVLVLEELDWLSPQTQRFLKDALDPIGSMPSKLVVLGTSNGAGGLLPALIQRFRVFSFSSGPMFAAACQERLAKIWA
ncbi:MAG TPA: AAA family ATPase, partial [Pirellulales bacterium]|nr:AAA family ATPase [Pirellulales bacterium]